MENESSHDGDVDPTVSGLRIHAEALQTDADKRFQDGEPDTAERIGTEAQRALADAAYLELHEMEV